MFHNTHFRFFFTSIALVTLLTQIPESVASAQGRAIDFAERFAMSDDRAAMLGELVPGTEEYYFYQCLHFQNTQQFAKADEMLQAWDKRLSDSAQMREIQHRQALLQYATNPRMTREYLIDKLNLRFDHQRQRPSAEPGLPTQLDQSQIAYQRLLDRALRRNDTRRLEQRALRELASVDLSDSQLRSLLSRLTRPDIDNLPALVDRDLQNRDSGGFGSMEIHRQMLLPQLDEMLRRQPRLRNSSQFVNIYLTKLLPDNDVDWQIDRDEHVAYLDRLWAFASTLNDGHNSLKANILFRRLELDRQLGIYDRARFVDYLKLPRQVFYVTPELLRNVPSRAFVDMGANYSGQTRLAPIQSDEPLVRDYLHYYLVDAEDWKAFSDWIEEDWLKERFAEAKITAGLGDSEQWASMLTPAGYKALMQRVDLEFLPTNPQFHDVDQTVELELITKNIDNLIVKVFEINTANYYRQNPGTIGTDINLDGLVPNWQETYQYADPAAVRVKRKFSFDQLDKRGVYVIDFIGNGTSSRALVRKGKLQQLVETTAAGQLFTILDENREQVTKATLWVDGHHYTPEEDGRILIPFTTQPAQEFAIIELDGFHNLISFNHTAETYQLVAGIYADRESLLMGKKAPIVIRPQLLVGGVPTDIGLLEDVRLLVRATDLDGIESTKTFANLEFDEHAETTVEVQVPPRLQNIRLELHATVQNMSLSEPRSLTVADSYQINQIDRSQSLQAVNLRQNQNGFQLSVRGKTGEVRRAQAVLFRLKHRDFTDTVDVRLQSDENGQIFLGALSGIERVTAELAGNPAAVWMLDQEAETRYQTINATTEQNAIIPVSGRADQADDYSLLEIRGATYLQDRSSSVNVADGIVTISDLPPGDYELKNLANQLTTQVKITEGRIDYGFALGKTRNLEIRADNPLHVKSIERDGDRIRIQLGGDYAEARVHVLGTRYLPEFDVFDQFARTGDLEPLNIRRGWLADSYVAGRTIGEEYQYILDRRYAEKFPGNMLVRPSLLLNPWALRTTENEVQVAAAGDEFFRKESGADARSSRKSKAGRADSEGNPNFATLDFLLNGTEVLWQLRPDENGVVEIDPADLGAKHFLRFVVANDWHTLVRTHVLPEQDLRFRDLRLSGELALDPDRHFTRQKQYTVLQADEMFELSDIGSAQFQQYDTLGDIYRYYLTTTGNANLQKFSFLTTWPEKTDEEKFELYTKHACHELNFFLRHKDPEYFDKVVAPYLVNKYHQTFLDNYLLTMELDNFLQPWEYSRLNTVEKILLGQREDDRRRSIGQFIGDDYANHPTSRRDFDRMFDFAVAGSALETEGKAAEFRYKSLSKNESDREVSKDSLMAGEKMVEMQAGDMPANQAQAAPAQSPGPPARGLIANKKPDSSRDAALADNMDRDGQNDDSIAFDQAGQDGNRPALRAGGGGGGGFGGRGRRRSLSREELGEMRKQVQQLYRRLKPTQEWVENNYYQLPIEQQTAELIRVNRFWRELALHNPDEPFLSPYFPEAASSFTEMVMAMAVLDLPFDRPEHELEFVDDAMELTPRENLIAFFEQVRPAAFDGGASSVLVSENFYRQDDRYKMVDGRQHEKFIRNEFLPHVLYGGQVVITNPTSMPQDVDLLLQIPEGAMPAVGSQRTRSLQIDLAAFSTQTMEYHFYFPSIGDFSHYPAHVSLEDRVVAVADGLRFNVIAEPSEIDTTSWAYVSQNGTPDQVIEYLENKNLQRIDLSLIAFRMKDQGFFQRAIETLRDRLSYNDVLWSYGLKHDDTNVIVQYLQHANNFLAQCGPWLQSELVNIQPVARHWYQHREYWPLVNARAHQLGPERKILNDAIWNQYHQLLAILARHPQLDDESRLAMTYYYLLQDRIGEALGQFERVNAGNSNARLQYDYLAAYLAMYESDPDRAAKIASQYEKYPVKRWRDMFAAVLAQVNEIRGGETAVVDTTNQTQSQTAAASQTPGFEFVVESQTVRLDYQNLAEVTVNYYLMDVELLFSRNPFVQRQEEGFAMIRPNATQSIELPDDASQHEFELPEEFRKRNVLVEINGSGQTRSQASYANSMNVQLIEQFGQMQVSTAAAQKPLPQMYVKVYARQPDGSVHFYKDGYTDLRGRFDYASLSNQNLDSVDQFAILVIDEQYGAVVREATVPKE